MESSSRYPKNFNINDYSEQAPVKISEKIEAFERFVNLNALFLGILQVLSLEMPSIAILNDLCPLLLPSPCRRGEQERSSSTTDLGLL